MVKHEHEGGRRQATTVLVTQGTGKSKQIDIYKVKNGRKTKGKIDGRDDETAASAKRGANRSHELDRRAHGRRTRLNVSFEIWEIIAS